MATATKRGAASRKARAQAKPVKKAAKAATGSGPISGLARKLALRAVKRLARTALESGESALRNAVEGVAESGGAQSALRAIVESVAEGGGAQPVGARLRQLPIQRSIDVAVPVAVAWDEWMELDVLPEGVARVTNIKRKGDALAGVTAGANGAKWAAEILDERARQSFAWRSYKGTDCAGLITFHRLGRRLTRLELTLAVTANSLGQTALWSSHLADRHADADLRRFKARVERIDPDTYPEHEPPRRRKPQRQARRQRQAA